MPGHTKKKKALRQRKARNVIRGLVQAGVKINPQKASAFTQEQLERKRLKDLEKLSGN